MEIPNTIRLVTLLVCQPPTTFQGTIPMNEPTPLHHQANKEIEVISSAVADDFAKTLDELLSTYPSFLYVLQTCKALMGDDMRDEDEPHILLEFITSVLAVANEIIYDEANMIARVYREKLNHIKELQDIVQLVKSYNAYDGMFAYSLDTLCQTLQHMTWTIIAVYGGCKTTCNNSHDAKVVKTYIIRNNTNGLIKIGQSRDVEQRVRSLSTTAGSELEILCVIDENIEGELHRKFSSYRTTGEWFDDRDGRIMTYVNQLG